MENIGSYLTSENNINKDIATITSSPFCKNHPNPQLCLVYVQVLWPEIVKGSILDSMANVCYGTCPSYTVPNTRKKPSCMAVAEESCQQMFGRLMSYTLKTSSIAKTIPRVNNLICQLTLNASPKNCSNDAGILYEYALPLIYSDNRIIDIFCEKYTC